MSQKRARVYAFCNNKGGITKTTGCLQIGYELAARGYDVCVLDTDPQCNLTYSLLGDIPEGSDEWSPPTLYEVILGINGDIKKRISLDKIIFPIPQQPRLFLAPGSIELSATDMRLSAVNGREKILRKALDAIEASFDYVLIDTPPTLGMLPVMACVAAGSDPDIRRNGIVIPIAPQAYSVLGIRILEDAFLQMREDMDIPLPIFGVLCSHNKRTRNAKIRLDQVIDHFGALVFPYVVPVNEAVEEAADMQQPLREYAPKSTGAIAYRKIANYFLYRSGMISKAEAVRFLHSEHLWHEQDDQKIWERIEDE